jgi:hypothetical protein
MSSSLSFDRGEATTSWRSHDQKENHAYFEEDVWVLILKFLSIIEFNILLLICRNTKLIVNNFCTKNNRKFMMNRGFKNVLRKITFNAAKKGHFSVMEWTRDEGNMKEFYAGALCGNNKKVLEWLEDGENYPYFLTDSEKYNIWALATKGGINSLEWLGKKKFILEEKSSLYLTIGVKGDISIIEWFMNRKIQKNINFDINDRNNVIIQRVTAEQRENFMNDDNCRDMVIGAACKGNLNIIEFLEEKYFSLLIKNIYEVSHTASYEGHIDILKWIVKKGYQLHKHTFRNAASKGHFDILLWGRENKLFNLKKDYENSVYICASVASYGNLEMFKWIRKIGGECDKMTFRDAAKNGHIHILKWIREELKNYKKLKQTYSALSEYNNNFLNHISSICFGAANGGHLEILFWAEENG